MSEATDIDVVRACRHVEELEKRQEFHALILNIPADVVDYDTALLVCNWMAKVAAEQTWPDETETENG